MRALLFLPSCLLCVVLFYLPSPSVSESDLEQVPMAHEFESQELTINTEERVAFFFNNSRESLMSLDAHVGDSTTHCASENLQIGDDVVVSSIKPVAPKDFASMCSHDAGTYPFTVRGVERASVH